MKKKKIITSIIMILVGVSLLLYLLFGSNGIINSKKNPLIGTWTTDGVTKYKFNEDNTGALIVSLGEYKFKYTREKDELFIDFENEKSEDTKYTYTLKDNKLTLKSVNGTFNFKKEK